MEPNNIFDTKTNAQLITRLSGLQAATVPLWGKMNASQMVLHCQKPLDVALGNLTLKPGLLGFLFGKWAKNKFLKEQGFGKNSPTAPQFRVPGHPDFEAEKNVLLTLVKRFGEVGPSVITNKTHPFFGRMTDAEWGQLQYLHLDHHLKQFGL